MSDSALPGPVFPSATGFFSFQLRHFPHFQLAHPITSSPLRATGSAGSRYRSRNPGGDGIAR
jgi:hypothetical protein